LRQTGMQSGVTGAKTNGTAGILAAETHPLVA